jgi:hypothetical protein
VFDAAAVDDVPLGEYFTFMAVMAAADMHLST